MPSIKPAVRIAIIICFAFTLSGCLPIFDKVTTLGKVTIATPPGSELEVKRLRLPQSYKPMSSDKLEPYGNTASLYLKISRKNKADGKPVNYRLADNWVMGKVESIHSRAQRIRLLGVSESLSTNTNEPTRASSAHVWNKYRISRYTKQGCENTNNTRLTFKNGDNFALEIRDLGTVALFYYDANHDGMKDLFIINNYECDGAQHEVLYLLYPKKAKRSSSYF
jgi:hypothetical protein